MDTPANTRQVLASALIVLVVGSATWWVGYEQGWNRAKDVVAQSGLLPNQANISTTVMSGVVESGNGQSLVVKVTTMDPFAPDTLKRRTVDADSTTVIERLTLKDPAQFKKETDAFNKTAKTSVISSNIPVPSPDTTYPDPFIHEKIPLSDIQKGDRVTLFSKSNISTATRFTPTKITVQPGIAPPPLPL